MLSQRSIGAAGRSPLPSDDEFNTVSFLSHFDGTNNGDNNAFDDSSSSNHTITANGNATQGSFGPFARPDGEWGVSFDGAISELNTPDTSDFGFGTGDFTWEAWIYALDTTGVSTPYIFDFRAGGNTGNGSFYINNTNSGRLEFYGGAAIQGDTAVPLNQWVHVACVRSGTTVKLYQGGVEVGSGTISGDLGSSGQLIVGDYIINNNNNFKGHISNVRIVKNTAVYTSAYTPPTAPLTAITNTKLLTCQSNRFVDNSASAHTITASGNAAVSAFGPFLTSEVYDPAVNGASAYFDGTGDYLSCGSSNDFDMSDGDITWDAWVYATAENSQGGNQKIICEYYSNSTNFMQIAFIGLTDIRMFLRVNNVDLNLTASNSVNLNQWHHIAVTRTSGGDWSLYIDGDRKATGSEAAAFNTSAIPFIVGLGQLSPGSRYFIGYIQDVRIVKGSLVYTGTTYTVPTAPLTAITNTKLLLNMADGQAIDSAAQNNLTLVGNAKISSTQSKFGGTSFYVPANGDYLKLPGGTDTGNFGTGNFTIEMWIYRTTSGVVQMLIDSRSGATASDYQTQITAGNELRSRFGGVASTTATVPVNEWVHIAIVRNNGTVTQYINGTGGGSYASTASLTVTSSGLTLGGSAIQSGSIAGYIDDIRISKVARYTSNFTPPTAAFADKGQ